MAGKKLNALFVRVDDDDRAAILQAADRERVTVSELVRRSARNASTPVQAQSAIQAQAVPVAANTDEPQAAIQTQAPEAPKPPPTTGPLKVHHIDDLGADGLRGGNGALKR
jgi:hypothetical protein